MGVVYRAEDRGWAGPSRSKSLPSAVAMHPELRQRLRREARAAATISHPAVAVVYALEEMDDHLFIASEYVRGETLRSADRPRPDRAGPRPRDRGRHRRRAGGGARGRRHPSRPEAGERAHQARRRCEGRGLRHRADRRPRADAAHARRLDARHARLHGARATAGRDRGRPRRHLRAGHRAERDADRKASAPGTRRKPQRRTLPARSARSSPAV